MRTEFVGSGGGGGGGADKTGSLEHVMWPRYQLYGYHQPAQRPGHLERPQGYSNNQIGAVIAAAADGTTSKHGGG